MRRIVLSGPTGTIGMALIRKCMQENIEVLAICHKGSERNSNIPRERNITVIEAELEEAGKMILPDNQKYDIFFHFAWEGTLGAARNDMPLQIQNIQRTLEAVNLAKQLGCHTFIGAGSQAEYGRVEGLLTHKTPADPENGYGIAKLCAGQMSRQCCQNLGIKHIWTRILSVYGPFDGKDTMIMSAIDKLVQGKRASFTPAGQMWDYLYSEDAAEAMLLLGQKGVDGKTYVLGSGHVRPLKEYIYEIKEAVDEMDYQRGYESGSIGIGDIPYNEKQVMYLGADIKEISTDTGFVPKTEFKEGIRKILGSYNKSAQTGDES